MAAAFAVQYPPSNFTILGVMSLPEIMSTLHKCLESGPKGTNGLNWSVSVLQVDCDDRPAAPRMNADDKNWEPNCLKLKYIAHCGASSSDAEWYERALKILALNAKTLSSWFSTYSGTEGSGHWLQIKTTGGRTTDVRVTEVKVTSLELHQQIELQPRGVRFVDEEHRGWLTKKFSITMLNEERDAMAMIPYWLIQLRIEIRHREIENALIKKVETKVGVANH